MTDEERRAADQDAAIEQAFVAGTLPEADRRITVTDGTGAEFVWVDDGSEVPNPNQPEDAGAGLFRDNATTPHVKADQHTIETGAGIPDVPVVTEAVTDG